MTPKALNIAGEKNDMWDLIKNKHFLLIYKQYYKVKWQVTYIYPKKSLYPEYIKN